MKFHGEYIVKIRVGVRIDADSLEDAQSLVKELSFDVDDTDCVEAHEWDVEPEAVYLFHGDE